ncbi:MAG TPA: metal-dependent hydrolase [Runella sp.]|nr:metal-dependent hydrolase [Runella sp.]
MENHSIKFGSTEIMFSIKYRERKSLEITVYPDGLIVVISPIDATIEQIKEKVYRKAAWIIKQLDTFQQFEPTATPRKYISGETHYYLGRQYRLKVIESEKREVIFRGGYIEVYTLDKTNKTVIEKAVEEWYRVKAKEKFGSIFKKCLEKLPLEEERKAKLNFKILSMPKRWGSCTNAGNILLNPNLVKTSKACIEYVILHELCHLVIPYHNTAFYELQTRLMPDWRELKKRLDSSV